MDAAYDHRSSKIDESLVSFDKSGISEVDDIPVKYLRPGEPA
jgi:hypothetical protein